MKTVFLFATSPKRSTTEFIKEFQFPLYPIGLIEIDETHYEIQLIETCLEIECIFVYLKD